MGTGSGYITPRFTAQTRSLHVIHRQFDKAAEELVKLNRNSFQPIYDYILDKGKSVKSLNKIKPADLPDLPQYQYMLTRLLSYSEYLGKASERHLSLKVKAMFSATTLPEFKVDYEMPYYEAAAYFKNLEIVDAREFYKNLSKYAGSAYTISWVNSFDTLSKVKFFIANQLESGEVDPELLQKAIQSFVVANGDDPLHPWHLDTVVRTNLNTAFSKGRYLEQLEGPNDYWQYFATIDGRETPICHALDGMVFRREDAFWGNHYPPNHFNCRSTVVTADEQTLKDEGLLVEDDGKKYLEKVGDEHPKIKKYLKPARGFKNHPGKGLEKWLKDKCKDTGVKYIDQKTPVFNTPKEKEEYDKVKK